MVKNGIDRINRILSLVNIQPVNNNNEEQNQPHTLLKNQLKTFAPSLLGNSNAEISQWLSVSKTLANSPSEYPRILEFLNNFLLTKSFLVDSSITIADIAILDSLQNISLTSYPEVNRWALFINSKYNCLQLNHQTNPTIFPLFIKKSTNTSSSSTTTTSTTETSSLSTTTESKKESGSGDNSKKVEKGEKGKKTEKAKKSKKTESESKNETKEASTTAAVGASSEENDLDPSKLDFRVGLVLKCWDHPEAEKLLCEEIDLGESTGPRKIASGLRAHYAASDIQGRKVIVLANLKDRTMVGFKSQGMVVCASNLDHTIVKLLEPPANANIGDRVQFDGFSGEPASASVVAKKKILEKLLPEMKTNDEGIPMCVSHPFKVGGELVRSPVPNGNVG